MSESALWVVKLSMRVSPQNRRQLNYSLCQGGCAGQAPPPAGLPTAWGRGVHADFSAAAKGLPSTSQTHRWLIQ